MNGVIKRVVSDKGFGFIKCADGSNERFFHRSAVVDGQFEDLREGQAVTFDDEESAKGPRAGNVRPA